MVIYKMNTNTSELPATVYRGIRDPARADDPLFRREFFSLELAKAYAGESGIVIRINTEDMIVQWTSPKNILRKSREEAIKTIHSIISRYEKQERAKR